jgi:hypothetical protein
VPIDPNIALSVQGVGPLVNPMQVMQQAQQMRIQREQADSLAEERRASTELRQQQADAAKRSQAEADALSGLFGSGQPVAPSAIYKIVGPKRGADILKGMLDLQTAQFKSDDDVRASMLRRISGIKALPESMREGAYGHVVNDYVTKGVVTPDEVAPYSPTVLDDYEKQLMTPEQRATNARADALQAAQLPGIAADTAVKQQVAAGTVGGLTPEQQAQDARAKAAAGETGRHNRAEEAAAAGGGLVLTPEALDLTAHQFAMTGQLPPMGNGKEARQDRARIINRAADVYKNLDLPSQVAAYKANQVSLGKMQQQRDSIGAFEDTALKNLDQFLSTAQKIVDTGSPLLNKPVRSFSESAMGNPQMAAFDTARRTVIPEFAKILNNPNLSGQLSDSARGEVEGLLKGDATLPQILAVAKILKQDTANRRTSLDDAIKGIQQRIATPPGSTTPKTDAAPAGGSVTVRDPQGGLHTFPNQAAADAFKKAAGIQ